MSVSGASAHGSGTIGIGGDLTVHRMGFGAMRITGTGIWGDPPDRDVAKAVLRRAVELGVNFIDTADSYGPAVSEELIAEALHPYPDDLVIATKGGLERSGPGEWPINGRPEHLQAGVRREPATPAARADPAVPAAPARPDRAATTRRSARWSSSRSRGRSATSALSNVDEGHLAPRSA